MVKVYMNEWFFNMGLLGLQRILEYVGARYEVIDNYLLFDEKVLDKFGEYYFDYFTKVYTDRQLSRMLNRLSKIKSVEDAEGLRNFLTSRSVKNLLDKVSTMIEEKYKNRLSEIVTVFSAKRKSSKKLESDAEEPKVSEACEYLEEILRLVLKEDGLRREIGLTYLRNDFYDNFFGQISFLQKTMASKGFKKHVEVFEKDFVEPVKQLIKEETSDERFFEENSRSRKSKPVHTCMLCKSHKAEVSDDSFFGNFFVPLGMTKVARNFMWNFNVAYPICNLCILVLMCTPAGATKVRDFDSLATIVGSDTQQFGQTDFFAFINVSDNLEKLIEYNNLLRLQSGDEHFFESFVQSAIQYHQQRAKFYLNDIMVFEFLSRYESKKSVIKYTHFDEGTAKFLINEVDEFKKIRSVKHRNAFFSRILFGGSLSDIIYVRLREETVEQKGNAAYDGYKMVILKSLLDLYRKYRGGDGMEEEKRVVFAIVNKAYNSGQELHRVLRNRAAENKIQGVSYRLLNFARAGDKNGFVDSLIRMHVSQSLPVPQIVLDMINESKVDFETLAYAYVSGLLGEQKNNDESIE
ncbi:type I-B CRISPR-associated protein Cas8b1/Cst1 [Fervidobacterium islandicum]|uniref:Type I-B CRISPR-associated protein Cas8b1/Cst1 n=1 Tax=Fervidobacterium islandicum TaxID=2423 RepID=A0AAI8CMH8_FERIS|nr:type I-B CRISPR-associated protein Cas8b1/Cst1 [Fervidobacterium islandicum]AMW33139.1 type I-B CRISPR-associated protein Cas8b1/Cst1 [Fervidobacterium islandicum]